MAFAFGPLGFVEAAGPVAEFDRAAGELVKGLEEEFGTGIAAMHTVKLATGAGHRRDATESFHRRRLGEPVAVRAERGHEPRGETRPGAWEAGEDRGVRMGGEQRGDLAVVFGQAGEQRAELAGEALDAEGVGGNDGRIGGQGGGGFDLGESVGDQVGAAAVVGIVEGAHGLGFGLLQRGQRGPLQQEIDGESRGRVRPDPFEGLGEVGFQRGAQLLDEAGALVDEVAALLAEQGEVAGGGIVGHPGAELVAVFDEQFPDQAGIDGIGFGATGCKRIAVAFGGDGVDGIENEEVVAHQRIQQRPAGLFEGEGDGPTAKALAQCGGKLGDGHGRVRDRAVLWH